MIQCGRFSFVLIGYFLIAVVGCGSDSRAAEESAGSAVSASIFSKEQTSYLRPSKIEDVSYGNVKRVSQRIIVPLGRTKDQLTATLDRAARELAQETRAKAVMVFAYRPQDDPSGQYSVRRAVYAPNGRWEEAASSAPMRISVDLNDLYFTPTKYPIAIGETVRLKAPRGGLIELSKGYGSWTEKDIIARVPEGTDATIFERRSEPMGNQEFVRYRVRMTDHGSQVNGWVHQNNVEIQ
ncbi:MAG: hypothetical protein P9F75_12385 [Candidatus Contendobacter sp.]|nr:hypothetical protein [Candidatus Contendobacter sp.]